ncbi:hypothetical protein [Streptomyces goshikiensis]|uniref:hypothetical protein n=1 Tax=Streptomyces goshikiensis TaxID=1942 RepID=UPI00364FC0EF
MGSTPVLVPRKGRRDMWGVRTPEHFNNAKGKKDRYWIGRGFKTKTSAEKALQHGCGLHHGSVRALA